MDPAALGTTIIGLERIRRDEVRYARGEAVPARSRPVRRPVRRHFGTVLRWTADRLDPRPAPAG